jgi:hypothetical protein
MVRLYLSDRHVTKYSCGSAGFLPEIVRISYVLTGIHLLSVLFGLILSQLQPAKGKRA